SRTDPTLHFLPFLFGVVLVAFQNRAQRPTGFLQGGFGGLLLLLVTLENFPAFFAISSFHFGADFLQAVVDLFAGLPIFVLLRLFLRGKANDDGLVSRVEFMLRSSGA